MTIAEQLEQRDIEKGRKEGREEGKIQVVLNLIKGGIFIDLIASSTGLSVKEIEKLKAERWMKASK